MLPQVARKLDAMGKEPAAAGAPASLPARALYMGVVYGRWMLKGVFAPTAAGGAATTTAADAELAFEDTYALNTIASRILSLPPTW